MLIYGDIMTITFMKGVVIVTYSIRELTKEDFNAGIALGSYAFRVKLTAEQVEQQQNNFVIDGLRRFGLFEGEQLCSQIMDHEFEFMIQGKPVKSSGIAFVSSWPEYRRNGYVAKLLEHAFIEMKKNNQVLSVLHPFSIQFYRKFGYELLSQRIKNKMVIKDIVRINTKGTLTRETDYLELKEMYDAYSVNYNGMLVRNKFYWEHTIAKKKKGHIVVYRDENHVKRGYMIYHIEPQSTTMQVLEFIALTKEAHDAIWSFIGQHDSMLQEVEWSTPYTDYQVVELVDPRIKREIEQYGMVRIVDVSSFLNNYSFLPVTHNINESYYIYIEDKHAPWNEGYFKLTIKPNGEAELVYDDTLNSKLEEQLIKMSINSLSGLLVGYYTVEHLIWNNHLIGTQAILDDFARRIPKQDVQLADYF